MEQPNELKDPQRILRNPDANSPRTGAETPGQAPPGDERVRVGREVASANPQRAQPGRFSFFVRRLLLFVATALLGLLALFVAADRDFNFEVPFLAQFDYLLLSSTNGELLVLLGVALIGSATRNRLAFISLYCVFICLLSLLVLAWVNFIVGFNGFGF